MARRVDTEGVEMRRHWHGISLALAIVLTLPGVTPPGRILHPATTHAATARLSVDAPAAGATVLGEIAVTGWAADPSASAGTGIDAVHIYLDRLPWEGGTLLGGAEYGLARDDVAELLGDVRYAPSGFRFRWRVAATPGSHTLYVLAHGADDQWAFERRDVEVDARAPRYPELRPPGDSDDPINRTNAGEVLFDIRDAMAAVTSMREHRTGRLSAPDGSQQDLYLYNLEYQAPDRRSQRSTVTTLQDSKEQRIITIGETSWFWREGDRWEKTTNRTAFVWPGTLYYFTPIIGATRLADDEIDGRAYQVVEFTTSGSEWSGAPGWAYRVRLWVDAETHLPLKALKAATTNQVSGAVVLTFDYREETEFFDYNAPIEVAPPG